MLIHGYTIAILYESVTVHAVGWFLCQGRATGQLFNCFANGASHIQATSYFITEVYRPPHLILVKVING